MKAEADALLAGWSRFLDEAIRNGGLEHVSVVVAGFVRTLRIDRRDEPSGVYSAGYVRTTCGLRFPLSALAPVWSVR